MNEKLLKETMEKTQRTIEESKEWQDYYNKQVKVMLEQKEMLKQFYKTCKNYDYLQFHIVEVNHNPPHQIKIQVRYWGQVIAIILLSKEGATITTEDDISKKVFNCSIQLKDEEWNNKATIKFLEYFNKPEIPVKSKLNETSKTESLLLKEFSKTSSTSKILTGIQPIKFENLYYSIEDSAKTMEIKNLARSKVRKITIIEVLEDTDTQDTILTRATEKAVYLINLLLKTKEGGQWYKIMGFHGRLPSRITIKVVVAVPKNTISKCKEFEPFELKAGINSIEYHHLTYETDGAKITSIKTTLND